MKLVYVLAFLLAACSTAPKPAEPPQDPIAWPAGTDCDGLLWAGLAAASGEDVDLHAARDAGGAWHRRPVAYGDCYPDEAQSTISRDMFIGLLAGLVAQRDLTTIEATLQAAINAGGIMGEPFPGDGRVIWTPNVFGLYARAARYLGNPTWVELASLPLVLGPAAEDYQAHLQLLELALERQFSGELPLYLQPRAWELAIQAPNDMLAQVVGCMADAPDACDRAAALAGAPDYVAPSYARGPARAGEIHAAYARRLHVAGGQP